MDEEKDELVVATDQGVEIYSRDPGSRRRYRRNDRGLRDVAAGKPATDREDANGYLKVVDTGSA